MKKYNKDKTVVYIQIKDIMMLNLVDKEIPKSTFEKIRFIFSMSNEENKNKFIKFTNPLDIEFFGSFDWIVDYDEYIHLSEDEFEITTTKIYSDMLEIIKTFESKPLHEQKKYLYLKRQHQLMEHMVTSVCEIYAIKYGYSDMKIPETEVPKAKNYIRKIV